MSRQVTVVYAEESTVARFNITSDSTVHDLRQRACDTLATQGRFSYGFANGFPHGGTASIALSSGSHGHLDFNSSTNVGSLCEENETIIATVPSASANHNVSPQNALSSSLTSPLLSHIGALLAEQSAVIAKVQGDLEQRITAEQLLRQKEVNRLSGQLEAEKEAREREVNAEREAREREVNSEREAREREVKAEREARKREVKAERDARNKLSAQFSQHVKDSKAKLELKDRSSFEERDKLIRDHKADIDRERIHVDEKHQEVLRLMRDRDEYMQTISDDLDDAINATADFITFGDETGFDRIKLRNLLDRTQQTLALTLGLSSSKFTAAKAWRTALGPATKIDERRTKALQLLLRDPGSISNAERKLTESTAAMTILSEVLPRVRMQGDHVAHGEQKAEWYTKAVNSSHSDDRVALTALLEYISTITAK